MPSMQRNGITFNIYNKFRTLIVSFSVTQQPTLDLYRLIVEISRLHAIRNTHTPGRTSLNKGSVHRRGGYLHNTQHSQKNTYPWRQGDLNPRSNSCRRAP